MNSPRRSVKETFVAGEHFRVDESGCWIWLKYTTPNGYGYVTASGNLDYAHRHSYRECKGEIPEGLEIDHLCRVRNCINPDHLEPVTRSENQRRGARGFGLTGKCRAGVHEMTDENTYVGPNNHRRCRPCATDHRRKWHQHRRDVLAINSRGNPIRASDRPDAADAVPRTDERWAEGAQGANLPHGRSSRSGQVSTVAELRTQDEGSVPVLVGRHRSS